MNEVKKKKEKKKDGYEFEDLDKRYYQKKGSIDCAKEHIENDGESYMCGKGLVELGGAIRRVYAKNPEQFVREVISNFRTIGTQVWGFSSDLVFSSETEERFGKAGSYKLVLSGKEICEKNTHVTQTVSPELSCEKHRAAAVEDDGEIE